MKKLFLLITVIMSVSAHALRANDEVATIRFMSPYSMAEGALGSLFSNSFIMEYHYFITANDMYLGDLRVGEYVDVKVSPGTYDFVLYANANKNGIQFSDCTFERAKSEGVSSVYKNITVEAGQMYYIDLTKLKHTLSNEKAYARAIAKNQLVRKENTVQSPQSDPQILAANQTTTTPTPAKTNLSKVDKDIPFSKTANENTYALIIVNENYQELAPVNYAINDGQIFKQYCVQTLGIPEKQIRFCRDASYGNMVGAVDWLAYALNNFEGSKAIVYYCGHGLPDEKTGQAYIIPVDGKGTNMKTCYSLKELYKTLAATKAQSITYFLDACFTGANKEGSMLIAARGVARKPEKESLSGNTIVFSASSGDETAMTLNTEEHGLFTYYLLKKLQETKGDVTYGELADYIHQHVKKDAFLINEKPQTPVVATSPSVVNTWKNMKLK